MQKVLGSRTVKLLFVIFLLLAGLYFYRLSSIAGDVVGLWVWEGSEADREKRLVLSFEEDGSFMTAVLLQDAIDPLFSGGTWRLDYKGDICVSYRSERLQNTCFSVQFVGENRANFSLWLRDEPPVLMERRP